MTIEEFESLDFSTMTEEEVNAACNALPLEEIRKHALTHAPEPAPTLDSKVVIHYREPEAWSRDSDTEDAADGYIELAHSENYFKKSAELSEFINSLPISEDDSNELFDLIYIQMEAATNDAFSQALEIGLMLGSQHPEEIKQAIEAKFSQ